jgi:hypothetical protein
LTFSIAILFYLEESAVCSGKGLYIEQAGCNKEIKTEGKTQISLCSFENQESRLRTEENNNMQEVLERETETEKVNFL